MIFTDFFAHFLDLLFSEEGKLLLQILLHLLVLLFVFSFDLFDLKLVLECQIINFFSVFLRQVRDLNVLLLFDAHNLTLELLYISHVFRIDPLHF